MHDDHPMLQPYTMNDHFQVENSCYQVLTQNALQGERDGWRVGRDRQTLDKAAGNGHYLPLLLLEGSFVGSFAGGVAEEEAPSAEDLPAAADPGELDDEVVSPLFRFDSGGLSAEPRIRSLASAYAASRSSSVLIGLLCVARVDRSGLL